MAQLPGFNQHVLGKRLKTIQKQ